MLVVSHITPNIQLRHTPGDALRSPQRHRPTASQSAAMRSRRRKPVLRKVMGDGEAAARKKRRAWRPNGAPPRQERRRASRRGAAPPPAAASAAPTTFPQPRGWRGAQRSHAPDSDVNGSASEPRVASLAQALTKMTAAAEGLQVRCCCVRWRASRACLTHSVALLYACVYPFPLPFTTRVRCVRKRSRCASCKVSDRSCSRRSRHRLPRASPRRVNGCARRRRSRRKRAPRGLPLWPHHRTCCRRALRWRGTRRRRRWRLRWCAVMGRAAPSARSTSARAPSWPRKQWSCYATKSLPCIASCGTSALRRGSGRALLSKVGAAILLVPLQCHCIRILLTILTNNIFDSLPLSPYIFAKLVPVPPLLSKQLSRCSLGRVRRSILCTSSPANSSRAPACPRRRRLPAACAEPPRQVPLNGLRRSARRFSLTMPRFRRRKPRLQPRRRRNGAGRAPRRGRRV